ncbi:HAMP domain-containing histidine kinase [Paenibacillus albidus]|uniref:sensor histidine kinase n=1 Tax=Paenibacillus albidus TaxID=2041023 RepID=UPI001BE55ACB|nr:HAMP domain-containing sensor histidine kinase [Paenibacillus albidus]MBT2289367.1 HAMP domain-containing histidine kinase [Paenibacillus albidus]
MKNKFYSLLTGTSNLRMRMLWFFFISFVAGMLISLAIPRLSEIYSVNLLVVLISFIVPFFCLFFFLTRHIIRYVVEMASGLNVIAQGKLQYRVPVKRKDELGDIAVNINAMAGKLEDQISRERQMEKAKLELITGVSHDLRTPLTSIIGYLDLLKDKAYQDEEEHDRFVGNTYNKALQLKLLIDDLFAYTRLTTNEVKPEAVKIDLRELLVQLLVELEPIARENKALLETVITKEPIISEVDPEMIRRAIDNLLMNALKFSLKPGVIRVTLAHDHDHMELSIENDGTPITKDKEGRLFERFYKADDSRTFQKFQSGSGLGLSIARSIVELHGGVLEHEHLSGHFVFRILLPLKG